MDSNKTMPEIRQLPTNVVNKIAAGEVVERPASAVKELVENAIDAGAGRIDVTVEQGGTLQIRVVDDGCGIAADQLQLAVVSHATSKIRSDEDLFRVGTLGFRGEALASIGSISRITLKSRTRTADAGAILELTGGQSKEVAPCGCPVGTAIEVHELFFNTPVRRKFLKTTQTELGHCSEAFTRLALANPRIHFSFTHNNRLVHDLPPVDVWRDRVAILFGQELADSLISVESSEGEVRLAGYVADPSHSRGNNRMQYVFLNGRYIRDRSLNHALSEAYRGLLLTGRFPICFLRLELPPAQVDVNVHPTKLEVRFQDGGRLYSQLLGTLRSRFLNMDLTARLQPGSGSPAPRSNPLADPPRPAYPQRTAPWQASPTIGSGSLGTPDQPRSVSQFFGSFDGLRGDPATRDLPATQPTPSDAATSDPAEPRHPTATASAIQVMNRYLVAESENAIVVIDQHALHERILYEELRDKILSGTMETQQLLVPEPVDLSSAEAAAVLESRELLAELGVQVEPFGGGTVLVSSYPAMLANWNPVELLRSLAEQLTSAGKTPDRRDILDELLHMISCKAAIKAGDRLSPDEVRALVEQRELAQDSHHCPHGRPTSLVFTREELDKQFLRT